MSEGWILSSEKILHRIKSLEEVEGKDRLELVRSMRFMLGALAKKPVGLDAVGEQSRHHD